MYYSFRYKKLKHKKYDSLEVIDKEYVAYKLNWFG